MDSLCSTDPQVVATHQYMQQYANKDREEKDYKLVNMNANNVDFKMGENLFL